MVWKSAYLKSLQAGKNDGQVCLQKQGALFDWRRGRGSWHMDAMDFVPPYAD
jgi:hypothetical protein